MARHPSRHPARALAATLALGSIAGCNPLRLDSATSEVAPGGTLAVQGAGFADGLTLTLRASVEISLQGVLAEDGTHASGVVPRAAPAGIYDVVAGLGGAEATLDGAVRVISGGLDVHFLDVGQGDATLVIAPGGEALLIDGGPRDAGPVVKDAVRAIARGRLDALVLSHTDADHLGGVVELLQGDDGAPGTADDVVPTTRLTGVDDGSCDSQVCGDMRALQAWPFSTPAVGETIALGDAEVTVVAVDGAVATGAAPVSGANDDNERSVVVRLAFGGRTVLVTGDLTGGGDGEADVESALAARTGPVDVLRVSHHGSATSSAAAALAAWQPRALVISHGTDNAYCHPADAVVARLDDVGAPIYATGAGIVDDGARCGGPTAWPPQARVGLGTVTLTILADGAMSIAGDSL